jgi:hypothetical protein
MTAVNIQALLQVGQFTIVCVECTRHMSVAIGVNSATHLLT